jgi:RimJ/RimL family protein N-acetyltransferase
LVSFEQAPQYFEFAQRVLGRRLEERQSKWLTSLGKDGSILGVVVFSRFTEGGCEITVASDGSARFITKDFARAVAAYPFLQLGCWRVTAIIAIGNVKSLSLAAQLGFREEGHLRNWFRGEDAKILGLLREDCKWLKDFDGLAEPARST